MIVYLDTSVLLRILFRERNPVRIWGKWTRAYSSALLRVEAFRTLDRLRLSGQLLDKEVAILSKEIQLVYESIYIMPLSDVILQRASDSFPTIVGTLDALHLSTALTIRESEKLDSLLTHDEQLATAAESLGFTVLGVPGLF